VLERKRKAYTVESEITAFFAVLAMSDDSKRGLLGMGLLDVLLPLTLSDNMEVQENSAAAISNISSMGISPPVLLLKLAVDYSYFVKVWENPKGGLRAFILRFLSNKDEIYQHIALWTLTQLLESKGHYISHSRYIS
jgi:vacuolar protein 8